MHATPASFWWPRSFSYCYCDDVIHIVHDYLCSECGWCLRDALIVPFDVYSLEYDVYSLEYVTFFLLFVVMSSLIFNLLMFFFYPFCWYPFVLAMMTTMMIMMVLSFVAGILFFLIMMLMVCCCWWRWWCCCNPNRITDDDRRSKLESQSQSNEYHRFVKGNLILKQGLLDKRKVRQIIIIWNRSMQCKA